LTQPLKSLRGKLTYSPAAIVIELRLDLPGKVNIQPIHVR
jgi:hypothetical protein